MLRKTDVLVVNHVEGSKPLFWTGSRWSHELSDAHVYATLTRADKAIARQNDKGAKWYENPGIGSFPVGMLRETGLVPAEEEAEPETSTPAEEPAVKRLVGGRVARFHVGDRSLSSVKSKIAGEKEFAEARLAKWHDDFGQNPIFALERSDSAYDYAAKLEISLRCADIVGFGEHEEYSEEEILLELADFVMSQTFFRAKLNTNRSTSQGTNLLEEARVKEWAEFASWLLNAR